MILNRQRTVRVPRPALESFLRRVCRELKLGAAEITICLVSDPEIARMNEAFRKKKGPTDVLSFPAVARRKGARVSARSKRPGFLGDIAISPETARRNAKKFGRSVPSELQLLIVHGVLHLLGYNHEMDGGEMDRIERRLRRKFGLA